MCQVGRKITTQKQLASILNVSMQAWIKTTKLVSKEVKIHLKKSKLIGLLKTVGESFKIDKKALDIYQNQGSWSKLFMVINLVHIQELLSSAFLSRYSQNLVLNQPKKAITFLFGTSRQKYRQKYPLMNFISMRFCCMEQMLLQLLSDNEQSLLSDYFNVIQHFYLPLSCF